jgi:hypothetical protein
MNNILFRLMAILILTSPFTFAQDDETTITPLTEAGENLDLQAVLELFMDSESVEEFEKALNDSTNEINNVDLNEDGEVDYIRVVEHVDGDTHVLVLQATLAENEYQDVATINIEKSDDDYVIQAAGDPDIYGEDYYVEPEEETQASTTTVIVVMYGVGYSPWVSPYRWRVYPVWWRPWRPHPVSVYRSRVVRHHRHHYRHTRHRRTVRAHNNYKQHRKTSTHATQKNKKKKQTTTKNQTQNKQQTQQKQQTKNKNQTTTKQQTNKNTQTKQKSGSGNKRKKR